MEREIRAKYARGGSDEKIIDHQILVEKYELYLLHDRIDDAIEQVRQLILLHINYYENPPDSWLRMKLDPIFYAQNVARNCLVGFLHALNKKYKDDIPEIVLQKIKVMTKEIEKSTKLKNFHIQIPNHKREGGLPCLFCGRPIKSRGGLSNHLIKAHLEEYLTQLRFELSCFEKRLQDIWCKQTPFIISSNLDIDISSTPGHDKNSPVLFNNKDQSFAEFCAQNIDRLRNAVSIQPDSYSNTEERSLKAGDKGMLRSETKDSPLVSHSTFKIGEDSPFNVTIKVTTSFNLTIENDLDTLESLKQRRECLIDNSGMLSEKTYDHLLNLSNYDIAKMIKTIYNNPAFDNKKSYRIDAETKQAIIEKYTELIDQWKIKIEKLSKDTKR